MSEYIETPLEETGVYQEKPAPVNNVAIQRNEAMDAGEVAAARGESVDMAADSILNQQQFTPTSPDVLKEDYLGKYLSDLDTGVSEAISEGIPVDTNKVVNAVESVVGATDSIYGEYRAMIEAMPQSSFMSDEEKDDAALVRYLKAQSAQVLTEMQAGDWVADVSAVMLTPDVEDMRMSELADFMGMDFTSKDALDPTDYLGRLSTRIKQLPPKEAFKAVDQVMEGWSQIFGDNRLLLSELLVNLTGDYSEDWKRIENVAGKADKVAFAALPLTFVKGLYKGMNAANAAAKANNAEGMTQIVNRGTKGELSPAGVDIQDAADSAMPLATSREINSGGNNALATAVMKTNEEIDVFLRQVDSVNNYGLGLTEGEKTNAIERGVKAIAERPDVSDVRVVSSDDTGFTVGYKIDGEDVELENTFTVDDQGVFQYTGKEGDYFGVDLGMVSPNTRFGVDKEFIVQLPEQMNFQSASIRANYNRAVEAAYAPQGKRLSKTEHDKVDGLLLRGDKDEKEWSVGELTTIGVDGVIFSEREATAYKGIRRVVEHMYHAKDKQIADSWRANNVSVSDWDGREFPLKTYADEQSALTARRQTKNTRMVAVRDENGVSLMDDITEDDVISMYGKGFKLVRPTDGMVLPAKGTNVEWAFVKAENLEEPRSGILGFRTGYMPMIRKDAHYFLKEDVPIKVGNTQKIQQKTIRYFDNLTDAKAYKEKIEKEGSGKYELLADRELSAADRDMEYTNISGGLFSGTRKTERIPFGLDGTEGERLDALGSLQRYVNHLGSQMPYNLYRMGLRQRWVNTAKSLGAFKSNVNSNTAFDDLLTALDDKHSSYRALKDYHNEIRVISGIPTEAEKQGQAATKAMALWAERNVPKFGKSISARLHGSGDVIDNAANTARSVTFHSLLGMFNPSQWAVQASGGLVALSVNPVLAMKAMPKSMTYAMLDMLPANKIDDAIKGLGEAGLDPEGYKLWRQSGLKDSITSSNVDYRSLTENVPYDAGLLRRVISNDTFFFKSGELVNARLSFATAFERWKEMNPGEVPDTRALKDILARTEQYRLNMSSANNAKFQKGIASVPLQFQQVVTKFIEKMFNRDLTKAEKARMIGGQAAFFGSMGIPFASAFAPSALEMIGYDVENATEEELNLAKNGVFGWYFQDYLDVNSVIGGRMSLGKDLFENMMGAAQENVTLGEIALGPTGAIYDRSYNGLVNIWTAMNTLPYADDVDINTVAAVTEILARSLVDIPSSTANLVKAHDMTQSTFYKNKNGKPIFEWTDNNQQTVLFQALSFSPQEVQDYYLMNSVKSGTPVGGAQQNIEAKRIVKLIGQLKYTAPEAQDKVLLAISIVKNKYKDDPKTQKKILDQVMNLVKEPTDSWDKAAATAIEEMTSGLNDGVMHLYRKANMRTNPRMARELEKAGVK